MRWLIGEILGHRQASTKERYTHLQNGPLLAVANRTAERIAEAMGIARYRDVDDAK